MSLSLLAVVAATCAEPAVRVDCGALGSTQQSCEAAGCCWSPVSPNPSNKPWCFRQDVSTCSLAASPSPPFSPSDLSQVRALLLANVGWKGSGMVVAAPDPDTGPGGNYEYAWMRDEALTMAAVQTLRLGDNLAQPWLDWVKRSIAESDPNGIDIRSEPKFEIPSGTPYTGGWCRPQNDGPGLRALALLSPGMPAGAADLIQPHLDWVASNWQQDGCDLWEEVRSSDFFWNRYTMRAALTKGAAWAKAAGKDDVSSKYAAAAAAINSTLASHIKDGWVFESANRPLDTAVVEAFNVGDLSDGVFAPLSSEVVATVVQLTDAFCGAFDINQQAAKQGTPGVLYGRYPGDSYDGGNPWVLLSASVATLFYRQAAAARAGAVAPPEMSKLLGPINDLSTQLLAAGDAILSRVKHFLDNGMHMNEQIDKNTGKLTSAKDLTWNYVNVLKAAAAREKAVAQTAVVV